MKPTAFAVGVAVLIALAYAVYLLLFRTHDLPTQ